MDAYDQSVIQGTPPQGQTPFVYHLVRNGNEANEPNYRITSNITRKDVIIGNRTV